MVSNRKLRSQRILASILLLAALVVVAGAAYQALAHRADTLRFPRPGRLVDAGKFKLNLHCTGQGTPTVVLESGLADALDSWVHVQPVIARFTRVCSYDRAGYGHSEPGPMPRTSDRIAATCQLSVQTQLSRRYTSWAGRRTSGRLAAPIVSASQPNSPPAQAWPKPRRVSNRR